LFTNTSKIAKTNKTIPEMKKRRKIIVRIEISENNPKITMGIKLHRRFAITRLDKYLLGSFIQYSKILLN